MREPPDMLSSHKNCPVRPRAKQSPRCGTPLTGSLPAASSVRCPAPHHSATPDSLSGIRAASSFRCARARLSTLPPLPLPLSPDRSMSKPPKYCAGVVNAPRVPHLSAPHVAPACARRALRPAPGRSAPVHDSFAPAPWAVSLPCRVSPEPAIVHSHKVHSVLAPEGKLPFGAQNSTPSFVSR